MDVLIIDDEPAICEALSDLLRREGIATEFATDPREGIRRAGEARVILLDLRLPGILGFELLEELCRSFPRTPVIMVTAHGTIQIAVEAMQRGAFNFIVKPPDQDQLLAEVRKALCVADEEEEVSGLFYELPDEIVFRDPKSRVLLEEIQRVAPTDISVLLLGETGVGKEVFARLLHEWSGRAKKGFVKINCAAIPDNLFESELFGHEKGAFTGAAAAKPGRIELAAGGTLFLDEIGELPEEAQAKLLQFLDDKTFERVGGLRTHKADVRVLTATNRALKDDPDSFRPDLYYRIARHVVEIPPLRERREDVEALARHFLARFNARYGKRKRLSSGAVRSLLAHDWPGNVRELEHVLESAVAVGDEPEIPAGSLLPDAVPGAPAGGTLREQRDEFEIQRLKEALGETGGNKTKAAALLGISRRMLHKKLKKHEID